MQTLLDSADRQFLGRLNRLGDATIQDLCDELSVTATAVRQRLGRLMAADWVQREKVHAERGRPFHVYRVTREGRRQFGDDCGELARLLWQELQQIEEGEVRTRLMSRLRTALAERYGSAREGTSLGDRFRRLQQELDRQGFQVDVGEQERGEELLPVLREYGCPYYDVAVEDSSICDLEQSVFEDVLGVPVVLTQCCRDGHSCCEFQPVTAGELDDQRTR